MLNLMGKKILTNSLSKILFIQTYGTYKIDLVTLFTFSIFQDTGLKGQGCACAVFPLSVFVMKLVYVWKIIFLGKW